MEPMTGRTHQLRVHMQAIGHPIVGDPLYATTAASAGHPPLPACRKLELPHPATGQLLRFQAPARSETDPDIPMQHLTILTGASRGMGLAMARQLLSPSRHLLCISRQHQRSPAAEAAPQCAD
jgi:hypothetical protein